MRHLEFHAAMPDLRIVEHLVNGVDGAARHPRCLQACNPVVAFAFFDGLREQRHQCFAVAHARVIARVASVIYQLRASGHLAEFAELRVVARGENHVPIGAGKYLVGDDVGMGVAPTLGCFVGGEIIEVHIAQHGHAHIQQGHVDVLAKA